MFLSVSYSSLFVILKLLCATSVYLLHVCSNTANIPQLEPQPSSATEKKNIKLAIQFQSTEGGLDFIFNHFTVVTLASSHILVTMRLKLEPGA